MIYLPLIKGDGEPQNIVSRMVIISKCNPFPYLNALIYGNKFGILMVFLKSTYYVGLWYMGSSSLRRISKIGEFKAHVGALCVYLKYKQFATSSSNALSQKRLGMQPL
jgi:hypothetical protein